MTDLEHIRQLSIRLADADRARECAAWNLRFASLLAATGPCPLNGFVDVACDYLVEAAELDPDVLDDCMVGEVCFS